MEKNLYPLRFAPSATQRPWGQDTWLLADLGFIDSEVAGGWLDGNSLSDLMETYLEKMVGDDTFEYYGLQFPVTVRVLELDGRTPVFVHPDDTVAEQRYDSLGKAALWYVVSAEPGAVARIGFKRKVTAEELYDAAQAGALEQLMNEVPLHAGDTVMVEPGIVYAFSGKARLIEVSEASSLVFDLTDPDDLVEAFDFVSLERFPNRSGMTEPPVMAGLTGHLCPHFRIVRTLGQEEREDGFAIHVPLAAGAPLTLFPAETPLEAVAADGFFILPGIRPSEPPLPEQ